MTELLALCDVGMEGFLDFQNFLWLLGKIDLEKLQDLQKSKITDYAETFFVNCPNTSPRQITRIH
jgi:hypothetical protein